MAELVKRSEPATTGHDAQDHGHSHDHGHDHGPRDNHHRPIAQAARLGWSGSLPSAIRLGLAARLAIVSAVCLAMWGAVLWVTSS